MMFQGFEGVVQFEIVTSDSVTGRMDMGISYRGGLTLAVEVSLLSIDLPLSIRNH